MICYYLFVIEMTLKNIFHFIKYETIFSLKYINFLFFLAYLDVIWRGAEESQLPEKYLCFLKGIVHNDKEAHPELLTKLFGDENQ